MKKIGFKTIKKIHGQLLKLSWALSRAPYSKEIPN